MAVTYDSAGRLEVVVRFFKPLVNPATSTALRSTELELWVSDTFRSFRASPACGLEPTDDHVDITFSLGNNRRAKAEPGDFEEDLFSMSKVFSADRRAVTVRGTAPALANSNLICAGVVMQGPRFVDRVFVDDFLFHGVSPLDGNVAAQAAGFLDQQAGRLNNRLGRARRLSLFSFPRCRHTSRERVRCRGRWRLLDVVGRPTVSLRGVLEVSFSPRYQAIWRPRMRARLRWSHCPAYVKRSRTGRSCVLRQSWGRGPLKRRFRGARDRRR